MFRKATAVVRSFLRRPLFGIRVIPRDACVDPTLFPEQDYPVQCSKCDYLLRGLADGKCPECGTAFKRGQLLVRDYVTAFGWASWTGSAGWKWLLRVMAAWGYLTFPCILGFVILKPFLLSGLQNPPASGTMNSSLYLFYGFLTIICAGVVLLLVAVVMAIKSYRRGSWKRRAIIDAIKQSESTEVDTQTGKST